jgi:hypothetical protein
MRLDAKGESNWAFFVLVLVLRPRFKLFLEGEDLLTHRRPAVVRWRNHHRQPAILTTKPFVNPDMPLFTA